MTKIIMHGCNGKMGQVITSLCKEDEDIEIAAGIDISTHIENEYPVYTDIFQCDAEADVIIDFSVAAAFDALIEYSVKRQIPVIICSTGLDERQNEKIKIAASRIAVLKSANMSLGINALMELLKRAVEVFAPAGFDMEIIEKHHNQKLDAPSGTALALADSMNDALPEYYEYIYDRTKDSKRRGKKEIGIQAVRGGTIVGEHEVIFAGTDEVITFKHTAYSKAIFAKGAMQAAKYLAGKPAGLYDMGDVIQNS